MGSDAIRIARRVADVQPESRGSRIVQTVAVIAVPRDDGTVLLDVGQGRRINLDGFGARVWSALGAQPSLPALITGLRDDGTPTQRLAEDVTRLLARWRASGIITWR
jgi:hypothetical protein